MRSAGSSGGFRAPGGPRWHRRAAPSGATRRGLARSFTNASRPSAVALGTWGPEQTAARQAARVKTCRRETLGAGGPTRGPPHLLDPDHGQSGGGEGSRSRGDGEQTRCVHSRCGVRGEEEKGVSLSAASPGAHRMAPGRAAGSGWEGTSRPPVAHLSTPAPRPSRPPTSPSHSERCGQVQS